MTRFFKSPDALYAVCGAHHSHSSQQSDLVLICTIVPVQVISPMHAHRSDLNFRTQHHTPQAYTATLWLCPRSVNSVADLRVDCLPFICTRFTLSDSCQPIVSGFYFICVFVRLFLYLFRVCLFVSLFVCLVWSCPVLSGLVLSCLVLSCLALFCFVSLFVPIPISCRVFLSCDKTCSQLLHQSKAFVCWPRAC